LVAGLVAGGFGASSEESSGWAGLVAGVSGALGAWWKGGGADARARHHWHKWSDYRTLYLNAGNIGPSPTQEQNQKLINELGKIRGRKYAT
jgi:hypothetical protein